MHRKKRICRQLLFVTCCAVVGLPSRRTFSFTGKKATKGGRRVKKKENCRDLEATYAVRNRTGADIHSFRHDPRVLLSRSSSCALSAALSPRSCSTCESRARA